MSELKRDGRGDPRSSRGVAGTRARFKRLPIGLALTLAAAALLAACAPTATLNALASSSKHTLTEGVPYGATPRNKLDIYRPATQAPAGGWPVVVFFYGGSWNRGERSDYKFVGAALAARGVLVMLADYRLYPEVRYPEFLNDSAQALAYGLREAGRLGGNPRRVFVMGHSAGAYNAAMLALDARWLQSAGHSPTELAGWIGLAGPYDFLPMTNPDTQPVFFHPNYPVGSQPVDLAARTSPNAFLCAALKDDLVDPQRNTVALATRLSELGVPVTLKLYERVNHLTLAAAMAWPLQWLAPVMDDVVTFISGQPPVP